MLERVRVRLGGGCGPTSNWQESLATRRRELMSCTVGSVSLSKEGERGMLDLGSVTSE